VTHRNSLVALLEALCTRIFSSWPTHIQFVTHRNSLVALLEALCTRMYCIQWQFVVRDLNVLYTIQSSLNLLYAMTILCMQESAQLTVCNDRVESIYCMQSQFTVCNDSLLYAISIFIYAIHIALNSLHAFSIYCILDNVMYARVCSIDCMQWQSLLNLL